MSSSGPSSLPRGGMPIYCRQCSKPFNVLLRRSHSCGHCGYEYCSTCLSDGQALMPRRLRAGGGGSNGAGGGGIDGFFSDIREGLREGLGLDEPAAPGYEVERVCMPCLGMLQVTAAPVGLLRSLPLKRLKDYLAAYDIPLIGPKEKEDFVQGVVKARNPATGCLPADKESYYRRKSVPRNGQLPSSTPSPRPRPPPPTQAQGQAQARPPSHGTTPRPSPQTAPARASPTPAQRPPPPTSAQQQQHHYRPPPPRMQTPPVRPQATPPRPPPAASAPAPPVPTILSLVSLPKSYLASLSIGTLKAVLYENHVRVDFKQVLEKEELINRVQELIVDERKRLERQRFEEERLSNPSATAPPNAAPDRGGEDGTAADPAEPATKVPTGPMPEVERGLCVVCQDEEATLAVVDCGHLCICAACSDLIMATSQECPLCRTRIVTPQRLIRIYRV